jgi:DNA topoisomerase-2
LEFFDDKLHDLIKKNEIEKKLGLIKKHSSSLYLYDSNNCIKRYNDVNEIFEEFYKFRLSMYDKRKKYFLKLLEKDLNIIGWKIKFIEYVISGKIIVFDATKKETKSEMEVITQAVHYDFPKLSTSMDANDQPTYEYITSMALFALTNERRMKLKDTYTQKMEEYTIYSKTSIESIWLSELDELEKNYIKWFHNQTEDENAPKKKKTAAKPRKK